MKKDISTVEDVSQMVNSFYKLIQQDALLGPIFNERLEGKWDIHLEKMVRFGKPYCFMNTRTLERHFLRMQPCL